MESLVKLMKLPVCSPDYSTLCHRGKTLKVNLGVKAASEARCVLVDSIPLNCKILCFTRLSSGWQSFWGHLALNFAAPGGQKTPTGPAYLPSLASKKYRIQN